MDYLKFLKKVLLEASDLANKFYGKTTSSLKKDQSVVTEADFAVGQLIIDEINKNFPTYNIINEETGGTDKKSEFTWVIDPIDGTSNYAEGLPHYGVMVGLFKESDPIAGGIILPAFGKLYLAEKGKGATCNGEKIQVTKEADLANKLIAFGFGYRAHDRTSLIKQTNLVANLLTSFRDIRISNSVFDWLMVAEGKYGGVLGGGKIWDHVALEIIIKEAGGEYTLFSGEPLNYSGAFDKLNQDYDICAGAPVLHKKLLEIIKQQ